MKTEKFQLRGNNSVYARPFQLLRGRAPHPHSLEGTLDTVYDYLRALDY
jgi:hypothetical protein